MTPGALNIEQDSIGIAAMVQTKDQKDGGTSPKRPLVAFLGPPSSFTHQVRVLACWYSLCQSI